MSFWGVWIFVLTLLFIGWLYRLFRQLERDNATADFTKAVGEFDGIEERDAALPPWVIKSFFGIFGFLLLFIVLFPGVYRGLIERQPDLAPEEVDSRALAQRVRELNTDGTIPLVELAQDEDIRRAGQKLYETHCGSCHGMDAQGNKSFPNLVDNDHVYGETDQDLIFYCGSWPQLCNARLRGHSVVRGY